MIKYTYELLKTEYGNVVIRSDGACIPINFNNTDYQAYLKWREEQESA